MTDRKPDSLKPADERRYGPASRCTPEMIETFASWMLKGHYCTTVCKLVGIGVQTYYNWMRWAEERPDSEYAVFRAAIEKAEAQAENDALAVVRAAAKGWTEISLEEKRDADGKLVETKTTTKKGTDWQAAQKFLMHRYQDTWGHRPHVTHSGDINLTGSIPMGEE